MDTTTKRILIIGSIITFIIVPVAAYLILNRTNQQADTGTAPATSDVANLPARSDDELATAIKDQSDALSEVPFVVMQVKKPQKGWYVVIIRNQDDPDGQNPAKVLLQDTTAGLSVLLGPGTAFPSESTQSIGVPDDVAKELNS